MGWKAASGRSVILLAVVGLVTAGRPARCFELPDAAREALEARFPGAELVEVEREREEGAVLNDVTLRSGGLLLEVEVTDEGVLGEIESVHELDDLPPDIPAAIQEAAGGGRILRIERHERRGAVRDGRMVPLDVPAVTYEVTYRAGRRRRQAVLHSAEPVVVDELPPAVLDAVRESFPDAEVRGKRVAVELGRTLYHVALARGEERLTAGLAPDGTLVLVDTQVGEEDVPAAALDALREQAGQDELGPVTRREPPPGADQPDVTYRAVAGTGRRARTVQVDAPAPSETGGDDAPADR